MPQLVPAQNTSVPPKFVQGGCFRKNCGDNITFATGEKISEEDRDNKKREKRERNRLEVYTDERIGRR